MKAISLPRIASACALGGFLLLAGDGCASNKKTSDIVYKPDASLATTVTVSDARRHLRAAFSQYAPGTVVRITREGIQICYSGSDHTDSYYFGNLSQNVVRYANGYGIEGSNLFWEQLEQAQAFADAFYVLAANRTTLDEDADFQEFKEEAIKWRALVIKPPLSKEAQKFQFLAENAIGEKNFPTALDYYEKALEINPFWPDIQYNTALIAAELGDYADATDHIRRYLELAPDSPDAPAAKKSLAIWEEKSKTN